jgi:hypothetical protein
MSKYINADEFIIPKGTVDDIAKRGVIAIHDLLEIQPSANVRENIHGEWVEGDEFLFCGETYTTGDKCSVCGRTAMSYPWHFCPNCGAYMRGETE